MVTPVKKVRRLFAVSPAKKRLKTRLVGSPIPKRQGVIDISSDTEDAAEGFEETRARTKLKTKKKEATPLDSSGSLFKLEGRVGSFNAAVGILTSRLAEQERATESVAIDFSALQDECFDMKRSLEAERRATLKWKDIALVFIFFGVVKLLGV